MKKETKKQEYEKLLSYGERLLKSKKPKDKDYIRRIKNTQRAIRKKLGELK